ncbi:fumarylacetoacetase [Neolewinella persica]|uniref:fumarylacetoacetase n=1 Tax=Neolewinella persica TaxID=70998 RepID=UPI0003755981|nr:fumarylacetoacetase [Neolewinella persica]
MLVQVAKDSDFTIHNLPWGIFSVPGESPRVGMAIGDQILDMVAVAELELFDFDVSVFYEDKLNPFIALGKSVTNKARTQVQGWLKSKDSPLAGKPELFVPQAEATMHLPISIGDYTDFYSSIEHATNVGRMFRDPENALLPNWRHLPVGYHGRSSSIIESGVPIRRPKGQTKPPTSDTPIYGPSKRLDFELEMGFVIGKDSELGQQVSTDEAEDYIFGLALFNDWSARDIQKWEYVPLGPFLGKSFASSLAPWIVTLEALEPFRTAGPAQDPAVLPYLASRGPANYNIQLEVGITPKNGTEQVVSRSNFGYMYWSMRQQLAHHTVNGCNVRVGDLMASGTISGKDESSYGSMLEISKGGKQPFPMNDGSTRSFLDDGDTVTMRGWGEAGDIRVGFGEVSAEILPASPE